MFALVDVNSFYASCETIFRPDLRGRPVIVLSNNDGCVIARSAEAKALGVPMGAPYFKIKEEMRRRNVAVFSSNYALYADMSRRVMDTLEEMAPAVEIYSLDEAFLRLDGVAHCEALEQFGQRVRDRIRRELHLTVGVGIAPSKTLAKLANFAAKKWRGTGGVVDLSDPARQRKLLALIPVEEVWGVGRRLTRQLQAMGIHTALQLADCDTRLARKTFSVVLERTIRELRGESCLQWEDEAAAKEQIICSRSFGQRLTHYPHMREAICSYAERAAEKLRQEKRYCRNVSVFIKTSPHSAGEGYYSNMGTARLQTPSNDSRDIIAMAVRAGKHLAGRAALSEGRRGAGGFQRRRHGANRSVRRLPAAPQQRAVDGDPRSPESGRARARVVRRAGDRQAVANEARNAVAGLHHPAGGYSGGAAVAAKLAPVARGRGVQLLKKVAPQ